MRCLDSDTWRCLDSDMWRCLDMTRGAALIVTRGMTLTRVCRSSSSWPTRRTRCAAGRSSPPPASRWLSSTGSSTLKHPRVRAADYRYYRSILDNNGSHAGINHNIDELLVGVYTQIRLRQKYSYKKPVSIDKVLKV